MARAKEVERIAAERQRLAQLRASQSEAVAEQAETRIAKVEKLLDERKREADATLKRIKTADLKAQRPRRARLGREEPRSDPPCCLRAWRVSVRAWLRRRPLSMKLGPAQQRSA